MSLKKYNKHLTSILNVINTENLDTNFIQDELMEYVNFIDKIVDLRPSQSLAINVYDASKNIFIHVSQDFDFEIPKVKFDIEDAKTRIFEHIYIMLTSDQKNILKEYIVNDL